MRSTPDNDVDNGSLLKQLLKIKSHHLRDSCYLKLTGVDKPCGVSGVYARLTEQLTREPSVEKSATWGILCQ